MPVFEVMGIERPPKKDVEENGAMEKLVFGPVIVIARTEQQACIQAVLGSEAAKKADQGRLDLMVRLFG